MPLIILDRDGVINVDSPDYIKSADEWKPIDGSIDAIVKLCDKGYKIYVATNQAGLARNLFTLKELQAMHDKLESLVTSAGGSISGIMYCPHHPDEGCECRKPNIGLLEQIAEHSNEEVKGQHFVGDSLKDIQAALKAEAIPVLVLTGNGSSTLEELGAKSLEVSTFADLNAFADSITAAQGANG